MRPTRIGMQGPDLWFLLMCPNARIVRQVWLDPKLFGAPIAEAFEERDQGLAGGAERIGDPGRRGMHRGSVDDAILFQFAELGGENFLADASEKIAELGKAQRTKRKAPDRLDFPLAAQDVDGGLNGTAMVRFHVGTPGLQICAYFAAAQCRYTMSGKRWARASQPECGRPSRAAERKQEQE